MGNSYSPNWLIDAAMFTNVGNLTRHYASIKSFIRKRNRAKRKKIAAPFSKNYRHEVSNQIKGKQQNG